MRAPLRSLVPVLLLLGACGTLAEPGVGDRELPTGRGGPFRLVEPAEMNNQLCALVEVGARLDDPSPVRVANGVALYFTYVRGDFPRDFPRRSTPRRSPGRATASRHPPSHRAPTMDCGWPTRPLGASGWPQAPTASAGPPLRRLRSFRM